MHGMEVGSHSMTHADLAALDPKRGQEIAGSRQVLGEILGEEVEDGYPYGSLDGEAVVAAHRRWYAYACGWRKRRGGDGRSRSAPNSNVAQG